MFGLCLACWSNVYGKDCQDHGSMTMVCVCVYVCVCVCVCVCVIVCVCVLSVGDKVPAQSNRYRDYTIWTIYQRTKSRVTTFVLRHKIGVFVCMRVYLCVCVCVCVHAWKPARDGCIRRPLSSIIFPPPLSTVSNASSASLNPKSAVCYRTTANRTTANRTTAKGLLQTGERYCS